MNPAGRCLIQGTGHPTWSVLYNLALTKCKILVHYVWLKFRAITTAQTHILEKHIPVPEKDSCCVGGRLLGVWWYDLDPTHLPYSSSGLHSVLNSRPQLYFHWLVTWESTINTEGWSNSLGYLIKTEWFNSFSRHWIIKWCEGELNDSSYPDCDRWWWGALQVMETIPWLAEKKSGRPWDRPTPKILSPAPENSTRSPLSPSPTAVTCTG